MTRRELCEALRTPDDAPAGDLLASWQRRRSELGAALAAEGNAKPVKLRLREELRRLEAAETVAAELRVAADFDRYFAEFAAERAKPQPVRGVLELCLDKARQVVPQIGDPELRFACEKKLAAVEAAPPPPSPMVERVVPNALSAPVRGQASSPLGTTGSTLELHPIPPEATLRAACPTIRLIARPSFTLGRQSGADLVARFLPDTAENQRKTSTISRINTTLFIRGRQLCVQDGRAHGDADSRPSRNGTLIDDQRILGALPLNFTKERRFQLGQYGFEVKALHLPGSGPAGAFRASLPGAVAGEGLTEAERPSGCVRFQAADSSQVLTVWILSEAGFGSGPDAAVTFDRSVPPTAARVHFWEGQFWLEVPSGEKSVVALDGAPRAAGDVLRLAADQELGIGAQRFTIRLP